jgi:beta-lactamase superfamily II metal-dependent hydrolase
MQWTSGDGVTLEVLAPSMPFLVDTGDDVNENSIVVMLRADGFRELFWATRVRRAKLGS